jgi:hypothetical protein
MHHKSLVATLLTVVLLAGCTQLKPVTQGQTLDRVHHLEIGDRLLVYEKGGRRVDMRYVRMDETTIYGSLTTDGLTAVRVVIDDIEGIETEQVDGLRTSLAVVGGVVMLPIVALGSGVMLVEALDN